MAITLAIGGAVAATSIALPAGPARSISERVGTGPAVATVVIDFGPRTFAFEVRHGGSLSGLGALQLLDQQTALDVAVTSFGFGGFVTGFSYAGYARHGDGSSGSNFWSYWQSRDGGVGWNLSGTGASVRMLTDGDVDGWVWSDVQPNLPPSRPVEAPEPGFAPLAIGAMLGRRPRSTARTRTQGFTLVELLVVIGIVGLLIAVTLPSLRAAQQQSQTVRCLSNLRQMAQAAQVYVANHRGYYPPSQYTVSRPGVVMDVKWDFTRVVRNGEASHEPGLLWGGGAGGVAVQQCPAFDGRSVGYAGEPFTGYNYNTSYIGGEPAGTGRPAPARAARVRKPSQTVLFGDGQYAAGANKFMRSPLPSPAELTAQSFFVHGGRYAGTQGFRHRGNTSNAAFADGHAASLARRHTHTVAADLQRVAPGTGFLSADNSLYDMD